MSHFLLLVLICLFRDSVQQPELLEDDVTYYLYTRENLDFYIPLNYSNLDIVNASRNTVFVVHGFVSSKEDEDLNGWYEPLRSALLYSEDCNIIEVDYARIAYMPYITSVRYSVLVGNEIGDFIVNLNSEIDLDLGKFHLIGHSMGGHIVGFAGRHVNEITNLTIARITSLDPAGLPYLGKYQLRSSDAENVVVLHTNMGLCGAWNKLGTVNIYPNGGITQAGCPSLEDMAENDNFIQACCGHPRSHQYYIESLALGGFTATKCTSWEDYQADLCNGNHQIKLSANITTDDNGDYYLYTNSESPFSLG